jgi:hypothetical protein
MDRIRAGLAGLVAVFLITAVASILFAPDPAQQARVEAEKAFEPGEPLAQLGVAPGSDKTSQARPETAPPPAQQRSVAPSSDTGELFGAPGATADGESRTVAI